MPLVIDKNTTKEDLKTILARIRQTHSTKAKKGVAAYFGSVKLKVNPLDLQKSLRNEWD